MKRKLFTGALLTTVVVGAALFSNAQSNKFDIKAGPLNGSDCESTTVPCNPFGGPACSVGSTVYALENPDTGLCTIALFRD